MKIKKLSIVLPIVTIIVLLFAGTALAAPEGTPISNKLETSLTIEPVEESPSIIINNDLSTVSAAGTYDIFTVSSDPGDYTGTNVRVKIELETGNPGDFTLYYKEQDPGNENYGSYLPLTFENGVSYFGSSSGFPLSQVTDSEFKVVWSENASGVYKFNLSLLDVNNSELALATTGQTVTVVSGNAMSLGWCSGNDPAGTYNTGDEITIGVTADLANGVESVDNVLYIIEVTKDGGAAQDTDFDIVAIDGNYSHGELSALNNSFSGGVGYWGPQEGVTFDTKTDTTMTVKFNSTGNYSVKIYAIQVSQ